MLAASGVAPWRLSRFLVRGLSLGFLKRVGGGYGFVHRPLLEYFANEHFAESSDDGAGRPPPDT